MDEREPPDDLPQRGSYPARLDDPAHQLDAYPIKDAAQRERLRRILESEPEEPTAEQDETE